MSKDAFFDYTNRQYHRAGRLCFWYRTKHRLSQAKMAEILHVKQNQVSFLERGHARHKYSGKLQVPSRIAWEIDQLIQPDGPDQDLLDLYANWSAEKELEITLGIKPTSKTQAPQ